MSTTIVNFKANVPHVTNMVSPRTGNPVANQFLITINTHPKSVKEIVTSETETKVYFQSYRSIIAVKDMLSDEIVLDQYYWDYSVTTGKYRNIFLGENTAQTRKKIKDGTYKLADLN